MSKNSHKAAPPLKFAYTAVDTHDARPTCSWHARKREHVKQPEAPERTDSSENAMPTGAVFRN